MPSKEPVQAISDTQNDQDLLIQIEMLQVMQNQARETKKEVSAAVVHHVIAAIADKNNGILADTHHEFGSAQTPSAATSSTGGPLPSPDLPPSGCPDASWPGSTPGVTGTPPYLDKLEDFLLYLKAHPTDSTATITFMSYLGTLAQNGVLGNSDVQSLLSGANVSSGLGSMVMQATLNALFFGYNGQNGQAGAAAFLAAMNSALGPLAAGNPLIAQMQSLFSAQSTLLPTYVNEFGFANGGTGSVTIGNVVYQFSNPNDQYYIQQYLDNVGVGSTPNPWYQGGTNGLDANAFERAYRMAALNDILKMFPNDPSVVLCLWIMQMSDNTTMSQIGGLSDTTNLMNNMANDYATPLITDAESFGNISAAQAQAFMDTFYNATNMMNMEGQLSGLAGVWNTNVAATINNMMVTLPGSTTPVSLGTIMQNQGTGPGKYSAQDLANGLNSLNPQGTGAPTTNPGYQGILNALQSAGSLITGTTNSLVTQMGTATQNDAQYLKFGTMISDPTGGGYAQMVSSIVNNQQSH